MVRLYVIYIRSQLADLIVLYALHVHSQLADVIIDVLNQRRVVAFHLFNLFQVVGIFLNQGSVICSQLVNLLLVVLNQMRVVEAIEVDVLEQRGLAQVSLRGVFQCNKSIEIVVFASFCDFD